MIFKMVNEQRISQVMQLWDYSFEKKDDPFYQWYFSEFCCKNNMVIGGFDEQDKLLNMLHLNPYMLRVRGFEQLTPYIVGVATAPAARGSHLFEPLLKTTFDILRTQQIPFVLLMPIHAGIYQPYQFSYCYFRHNYTMDLAKLNLKGFSVDLKVEYLPLNKEILAEIYYNITKQWNGVPVRTDFQWDKLLKVHALENIHCAVCYEKDVPAGYMLYKLQDKTFTVVELLASSQKVKNRLLQYAAQHLSEVDTFTWLAEGWDKTYLHFADQQLSGSLQPFMMARCIDARLALSKLPVNEQIPDGSVNLLLTDNVIAGNNHLLQLSAVKGKISSISTTEQEDVTMDMAAFTQMFFGAFTATELAEAGFIEAENSEKLAVLDSMFPKCRNFINEYF